MSVLYLGDNPASLLDHLQRLHADISRTSSGQAPTQEQLNSAPILDQWECGVRLTPCLYGVVYGHPVHEHCRPIHTSELYMFDACAGWARTWSRFYRLGTPKGAFPEGGNA